MSVITQKGIRKHQFAGLLIVPAVLLFIHFLVILYTGGYRYGNDPTSPIIWLSLVGIVWIFLSRNWRSHFALLLFCIVLVIYLGNRKTLSALDSLPARYLPLSILREGDFDLDEFPFLYNGDQSPYYVRKTDQHYVSWYPVLPAVMAVPIYIPAAIGSIPANSPFFAYLEKISAALCVALSASIFFFALRLLISENKAFLLSLLYALGTSSLSISSQALWQHGASQFFLCVALYCLVRGLQDKRWLISSAVPLSLATLARPTDITIAAMVSLYALWKLRMEIWKFVTLTFPFIALQLLYNQFYFSDPAKAQFGVSNAALWGTPFHEGLASILLSPARGLFIYSPIFLFSLAGMVLAWRAKDEFSKVLRFLSIGVLLNFFIYSKWIGWTGGFTYGPRLLADMTPILTILLVPVVGHQGHRKIASGVFVVLGILSIGAHLIGAYVDDRRWNVANTSSEAAWQWSDNQLLQGYSRVLRRSRIFFTLIPTSREGAENVSATCQSDLPAESHVRASSVLAFYLHCSNSGKGAWLGWPRKDKGNVVLGYQWKRNEKVARRNRKTIALQRDVLPGETYNFNLRIPAPDKPGKYVLELQFLIEQVGAFKNEPLRSEIEVY